MSKYDGAVQYSEEGDYRCIAYPDYMGNTRYGIQKYKRGFFTRKFYWKTIEKDIGQLDVLNRLNYYTEYNKDEFVVVSREQLEKVVRPTKPPPPPTPPPPRSVKGRFT